MIYIQKKQEPKKLLEYRKHPDASFDAMDADVKEQLRESLLSEQGHLCAYCMCRLSEKGDVKIEHWEPRNSSNELDYNNLLAVCRGNEGHPVREQTCDTKKGNAVISVSPLKRSQMECIYYTSDGKIHSRDQVADNDIQYVLNLNKENGNPLRGRKVALKTFQNKLQKYKNDKSTKAFLEKMQKKYEVNTEKMIPYIGILRWYIAKKLNRYI